MRARLAYGIAALILLAAIALALATSQWHWVSRSGSLIVVLGIVLTSSQVFADIRRLQQRRGELHSSADHDWSTEGDIKRMVRAVQSQELTWESERSGLVLLILGTLIWGFGDLPGLF